MKKYNILFLLLFAVTATLPAQTEKGKRQVALRWWTQPVSS